MLRLSIKSIPGGAIIVCCALALLLLSSALFRGDAQSALPAAAAPSPYLMPQFGNSGMSAIVFSPDGRLVIAGNQDNTARLWEVKTGDCLRAFTGHTEQVTSVAFSRMASRR